MGDDLTAIGATDLVEKWLGDRLEPEDVEAFRVDVELAHQRAAHGTQTLPTDQRSDAEHAAERVKQLLTRLTVLTEQGAGLSDEFSDDLDD